MTDSFRRLTPREGWIAAGCGFVAALPVMVFGRMSGFQYSQALSSAVLFLVMGVGMAYQTGRLQARPVRSIAYVVLWALVGAALTRL